MAASALKIESNRANAQHSTGPVSQEGKEISSRNASKHNLTGGPALVPGEDAEAFQQHLELYQAEYQPQSVPEAELIEQLADASWRLSRVARMEREILAAHPNPFLDPENPMAVQLLRLTRYRNAIQRTFDRTAKELQVLIEAESVRRAQSESRRRHVLEAQMSADGMDPQSAVGKRIIRETMQEESATRKPEIARVVMANRNHTRL